MITLDQFFEEEMILICEPQCHGFEHAEVNTALIENLLLACPSFRIKFIAEDRHLAIVKSNIKTDSISRISFAPLETPPRDWSEGRRFLLEGKMIRSVFHQAEATFCSHVLFTSITGAGIFWTKRMAQTHTSIKVTIILHSILEGLTKRRSIKPWNTFLGIRLMLYFKTPSNYKLAVLGESIRKELCRIVPDLTDKTLSIHLPYRFKPEDPTVKRCTTIRFGSFGVAHRGKGIVDLVKIANKTHAEKYPSSPQFILIGHAKDPSIFRMNLTNLIMPTQDSPLPRADYDRLAKSIDYAIFCYPINSYKLTASGAFFDALSYIKPIITIRNSFFDYYFNIFGDIGFLCSSVDEIYLIIKEILNGYHAERYKVQRNNIIKARIFLESSQIRRSAGSLITFS